MLDVSIRQGAKIPEPTQENNFLSLSYGSAVVKAVNAFLAMEVRKGHLVVSDNNSVLTIEGVGDGSGGGYGFPFRIIPGSTWLKAVVLPGWIITTGNPVTPSHINTELTLTSGQAHNFIYVDLTAAPDIKVATTAPTWGADIVPIGWVDTTDTTHQQAVIYQFTHDNIFSPCISTPEE